MNKRTSTCIIMYMSVCMSVDRQASRQVYPYAWKHEQKNRQTGRQANKETCRHMRTHTHTHRKRHAHTMLIGGGGQTALPHKAPSIQKAEPSARSLHPYLAPRTPLGNRLVVTRSFGPGTGLRPARPWHRGSSPGKMASSIGTTSLKLEPERIKGRVFWGAIPVKKLP